MTNHISIRTTTREGEEISILCPPKMSPCHRVASLVILAWWLEIIVIWPGSDKSRCVRCCGGGNVASFTDCKWMLFRSDTLLPHKAQTFKLKPLPPTSIHYLFATDIPKHMSMVCHDPTVQHTPAHTHISIRSIEPGRKRRRRGLYSLLLLPPTPVLQCPT